MTSVLRTLSFSAFSLQNSEWRMCNRRFSSADCSEISSTRNFKRDFIHDTQCFDLQDNLVIQLRYQFHSFIPSLQGYNFFLLLFWEIAIQYFSPSPHCSHRLFLTLSVHADPHFSPPGGLWFLLFGADMVVNVLLSAEEPHVNVPARNM